MPGIYVMAVLTLLGNALLCVATLNHLTQSDRRYYWLLVAGLPLSMIVNRFIKTPVISSIAAWTGIPLRVGLDVPVWFIIAVWLNAPIFEEAIKLLPLILPASRVFLGDASRSLWAGLALGMGFGLGFSLVTDDTVQRPGAGTHSWWGIAGTEFWVDPTNRVVGVVMTQTAIIGSGPIANAVREAFYATD